MNEFEIRRALAGAAPSPATPDPDRLRAALVHADRMRTVRTAMAVGALAVIACVGVFVTQTGESTAPTDVVDQPDPPRPDPELALIDDAGTETTTTTAPPTTSRPPAPDGDPGHLAAPTTTAAPALITVTTTTVPPTTTSPPTTTTAAATTTTTTTAPAAEFTAAARYGSCEEDPPYDEYSGTAAPGAIITVTSGYNTTAQTTADAAGDWFIRVEFPTAPIDEHFDVTVTDGTDSAVFDFVHTAA